MEHIPKSLKAEHESLRAMLKRAMREEGRTGEAARKVAQITDGHFLREEKFVLPLLGFLPALARGETGADLAQGAFMIEGLNEQLEQLASDHRQISEALRELARAAETDGKPDYVAFAEDMIMKAHAEEEVLYPAAVVAGKYINKLRGG
jgi:hypothetical protein